MQEKSKKNTEISERIYQVIEFLAITPNKFSKSLGYVRTQTIYDILNGKSAPSYDFFKRLFNSEYSEIIDPIWILTGNGSLKKNMASKKQVSNTDKPPGPCEFCVQKDATIAALNKLVQSQLKTIELLDARQSVPKKSSGQKRKAG